MIKSCSLASVLALGLFCGRAFAQSAAPRLVPGKSLGRVALGMTPAQVHRLLGKPDKTLRLKNGLLDDVYQAKKTRAKVTGDYRESVRDKVEVLYRSGRAVQLEATSPAFETADGLSTASNVGELRQSVYSWRLLTYGYSFSDGGGYLNYYFCDSTRGLTFEFHGWQDTLLPSSRPNTLIVHRKGTRVVADVGGTLETESRSLDSAMASGN